MSSSLVQPLESLSLVERHGNNESKSSASSPPFFLHILDLTQTRVEDLTIELKEEAHNHIRLACTQDMTIGAVKHALACELSQRRQDKEEEVTASTDVGLPLVHTSDMRIIFLTNRTTPTPCRPLTDLFTSSKTLFDYDVPSDSWLLLKRVHLRTNMPRLHMEEEEEGEEDEQHQEEADEEEEQEEEVDDARPDPNTANARQ